MPIDVTMVTKPVTLQQRLNKQQVNIIYYHGNEASDITTKIK